MLKLYAIKDTKGAFEAPFIAINDAVATRTIKSYINSGKDVHSQFPEDFELWYLGDYDELTGNLSPKQIAFIVRFNALLDKHEENA